MQYSAHTTTHAISAAGNAEMTHLQMHYMCDPADETSNLTNVYACS
jgi:hypothetical protein